MFPVAAGEFTPERLKKITLKKIKEITLFCAATNRIRYQGGYTHWHDGTEPLTAHFQCHSYAFSSSLDE